MRIKSMRGTCAVALAALGISAAANAAPVTYTDAHLDQVGSANKLRDIWSATVDNDATNLIITILFDPTANVATGGQFNYGVGITTGPGANGDTQANATTHGNPYTRALSIDSTLGGMTDWIGAFGAPGGGGSSGTPYTSYGFNDYVWNSTTSTWTKINTVASGMLMPTQPGASTPDSIQLIVPMADFTNLNLQPGSTINFDIYSTGTSAGQTAYDSLADQSPTNGPGNGGGSTTLQYNGTVLDSYTIQAVPEPMSGAVMALGVLVSLSRRSRRGPLC